VPQERKKVITGEEYKLWSFSSYTFIQPPVTASVIGPNIFLSTLFSNSLRLGSREQYSVVKVTDLEAIMFVIVASAVSFYCVARDGRSM